MLNLIEVAFKNCVNADIASYTVLKLLEMPQIKQKFIRFKVGFSSMQLIKYFQVGSN